MMKVTTAVMVAATAVAMASNGVKGLSRECEADHQCPGRFCYVAVGKCTACMDCSAYLRKPPMWASCAKAPQDCGSCIDGYEEEVFQEGARRDFCIHIKKDDTVEDNNVNLPPYVIAVLAAGCFLIFLGAIFCYMRKRLPSLKLSCWRAAQGDEEAPPPAVSSAPLLESTPVPSLKLPCLRAAQGDEEAPPPPYSSSSSPQESIPVISAEATNHLDVVVKETSGLLKAVPFRDPCFPADWDGGDGGDADHNEPDEGDDQGGASPVLDLQDEDTMPSSWTPGVMPEQAVVAADTDKSDDEGESRSESSLSGQSVAGAVSSSSGRRNEGDSGVSSSSSLVRHFASVSADQPRLSHTRSQDDIPLQPCKRLRRDSGSASMPDEERAGTSSTSTSNSNSTASNGIVIVNFNLDSPQVYNFNLGMHHGDNSGGNV